MSIFKALKWYYRNTASSMLLVLLLGACAFADFLARFKMDIANRKFASMDEHAWSDFLNWQRGESLAAVRALQGENESGEEGAD